MAQILDRKDEERELHDRLRGNLADDPKHNANKKFYSIFDTNLAALPFRNTFLFNPIRKGLEHCDADESASIVINLYDHPDLLKMLSENASALFKEKFVAETVYKNMSEYLEHLACETGRCGTSNSTLTPTPI